MVKTKPIKSKIEQNIAKDSKPTETDAADTTTETASTSVESSTAIVPVVLEDADEGYQAGTKTKFPKLADDDIKKHVDKINRMVGDSLYQTAIKVGNYVLKEFFNNDVREAMSKNPNKPSSYRKLQMHPGLKIHYNMLNNMVRVAAQEDFLSNKLGNEDTKSLSYSHRVELLKYDDETKIDIARKCISEKLSIRGMRERGKGTREGHQSRAINPFNAILTNILKKYHEKDVTIDIFYKLSLNKIQQMKSYVDEFLNQVGNATDMLTQIKDNLDSAYDTKKSDEDKSKEIKKKGRLKK